MVLFLTGFVVTVHAAGFSLIDSFQLDNFKLYKVSDAEAQNDCYVVRNTSSDGIAHGVTCLPKRSLQPTSTPQPSPSASPLVDPVPTETPSPSPVITPQPSPSLTPTPTPTPSVVPTPTPQPTVFQPTAPYYATFVYNWFQNPTIDGVYRPWGDNGHNPPGNWFANYLPDLGLYSSRDDAVIYQQLTWLKHAKQEVGIASWFGQNNWTDDNFRHVITDVMNRPDNPYPNFRWTMYYEQEGYGDPTVEQIVADLNYIKENYANQPGYLKINGKPVIFVYRSDADRLNNNYTCRWQQAKEIAGFYTNLVGYPYYTQTPCPSDSWHNYVPNLRYNVEQNYAASVSPGYWFDMATAPVLKRDLNSFKSAVTNMVNANVTWKLTETWNEWGEGTSVEPGKQVIQSKTGSAVINSNGAPFGTAYIDALNQLLPNPN